ncbi:TlpA disulfide reductase family protein [Flavobacterium sp. K5-23]|uniref:TlpA family protein disulfide reductase n=1 Tax=Flavobacterium sp. K5-23 TaxID=2746225 RepID=UPI00200D1D34|nr:TlpA disulfide reductase family protein [Flavobacterium sp. K5-23]UQD55764.1 TlpA family protein disulfide reductase [Flavobacterium sp. K5-23]
MKKIFFIGLGMLCSVVSIAQVKTKMSFHAEISNRNSDSLFIRNSTNGNVIKRMGVNKEGFFKDSFSVEEGIYLLYDGKEYAKIFVKNGYDLKLKMDAAQFDESMVFSGSGAEENNDLVQGGLLDDKYDYKLLLAADEVTFKTLVEDKKSVEFARLDRKNLDSNYKALQKKYIEESIGGVTQYYNQILENNKLNGSMSPSFNFDNYKGGKTKLEDFKGKYVYIDIWATWCGPCIAEIPSLKKVEGKYHDKNIVFLSMSIDKLKDLEKWKNMVKSKELGGVQVFADNDFNSKFIQDYKVTSIPRFILIDPTGKIVKADAERPSSPKLEVELDALLK